MKNTFGALLLLLAALSAARAQDSYSIEWSLTSLRGSWEAHTFYDKWTLDFDCDHQVIIDQQPADYTILPGVIRVHDNDGTTDFLYSIDGNSLSLRLPDGTQRTYKRTDPGSVEQTVRGKYYLSVNSTLTSTNILFDGDHQFVIHGLLPGSTTGALEDIGGVYRVEGDVIVFVFDDSTIDDARVSFRDDDGSVGGITYHDQLYETELPATPAPAAQTPIYYSAPVVDYVPMYVPVAPPPAVIPAAPPPPAAAIAPPPASKPAKRDFGTTRGTPGKR